VQNQFVYLQAASEPVELSLVYEKMGLCAYNLPLAMQFIIQEYLIPRQEVEVVDNKVKLTPNAKREPVQAPITDVNNKLLEGLIQKISSALQTTEPLKESTLMNMSQPEKGGLARKLIKIAKHHGVKDQIINDLLNSKTMNHGLSVKSRKYSEILLGQFEIGGIIRVNRKNDEHTISNKTFDFSRKTISELRK
jgi:hypothetical protein